MNSRNKGNRTRRLVMDTLEAQGYLVGIVERTGKFIKEKDLFGLFDLIAIKEGEVIFIQVKTNRKPNLEPFSDFAIKHKANVEVWIKPDRQNFEVIKMKV